LRRQKREREKGSEEGDDAGGVITAQGEKITTRITGKWPLCLVDVYTRHSENVLRGKTDNRDSKMLCC
jgi:hypothetical protein